MMNVFVRMMVSEKLQIRLQFSRSIQRTKNEIENRNKKYIKKPRRF